MDYFGTDNSYDVNTAGTVATDVAQASTQASGSGPDSWGGFFKEVGQTILGYSIQKDAAVTQASLARTTQPTSSVQAPDGRYITPPSGGGALGLEPRTLVLGVLGLIAVAVAVKVIK